jgi:sterol desaturase/sphingolipid hydroxylase (fatty acid hydroxylase superfamily)
MLVIFAVLALIFLIGERVLSLRPQRVIRRGFLTDVAYIPIHFAMRVVINGTVAVALAEAARSLFPSWNFGVLAGHSLWLQALVLLLVLDFFFYVTHRLKHRWHWWWRLHETHHSTEDMDFLSTVRFHPLEKALDRTIYLLPLLVLGVSDRALVIWAAVDAFFGMLIHSNLDIHLGPLIYVLNGPELHRWHHSRDRGRRECNYGNNFSIFDWTFGTAYLTREHPAGFGIDDPGYPEGNVVRQFLYAFRPVRQAEKDASMSL